MKPYLLFAGANYYPGGGISDYQGDFDSFDEAHNAMCLNNEIYKANRLYKNDKGDYIQYWDWWQIVQSSDMTIVEEGKA